MRWLEIRRTSSLHFQRIPGTFCGRNIPRGPNNVLSQKLKTNPSGCRWYAHLPGRSLCQKNKKTKKQKNKTMKQIIESETSKSICTNCQITGCLNNSNEALCYLALASDRLRMLIATLHFIGGYDKWLPQEQKELPLLRVKTLHTPANFTLWLATHLTLAHYSKTGFSLYILPSFREFEDAIRVHLYCMHEDIKVYSTAHIEADTIDHMGDLFLKGETMHPDEYRDQLLCISDYFLESLSPQLYTGKNSEYE